MPIEAPARAAISVIVVASKPFSTSVATAALIKAATRARPLSRAGARGCVKFGLVFPEAILIYRYLRLSSYNVILPLNNKVGKHRL